MPIRTVPRNPGQYALRRGRVSLPGQRYLVTTCTANRSAWFANRNHADRTCAILRESLTWPAARVLIWVLMPDHWHGLVELHGTEALSTVFARMKGIVSRRWPDSTPRPIWQRSFHDHALRSEEDVVEVGRYVLANPVRAGLVERWSDWKWRGGDLLAQSEDELTWWRG